MGSSAIRILAVYGGVATALSMWISNTATTAMMFPIGLSIVAHLTKMQKGQAANVRSFALAMMLITSFGASIGGMGTPVGTPPNLIGIGFLERIEGVHIGFFRWMAIGVPLVVILFGFLLTYFGLTCARGLTVAEGGRDLVHEELHKLGPVSAGERNVLIAFAVTVLLWIAPGLFTLVGLGESAVAKRLRDVGAGRRGGDARRHAALPAAGQLARPALHPDVGRSRAHRLGHRAALRRRARARGPGVLHGAGRGRRRGDRRVAARRRASWRSRSLFTGLAIVLSEATSNTASANMIVPVAIAVAKAAGVSPVLPAMGATLGSSMGFMMPISTAPNAIVYSSGHVPIGQMMKYGFVLDVAAFVVIVALLLTIGPMVF